MKKLALAVLLSFGMTSSFALAADYGLEAGIRQQSGDSDSAVSDVKSEMGFQFGAVAHFEVSGPWHIRSGMLYTQRAVKVEALGSSNKVTMTYLDIPVALMYKFEDSASVFAGVSLGMHLDSKSDVGTVSDEKSPLVPIIIGTSFKFAPQLGATLFYEMANGEVATGLKDYRAVGANLLITFD